MLQWNGKDLTSEDVYFMSESFSRAARSAREMARSGDSRSSPSPVARNRALYT